MKQLTMVAILPGRGAFDFSRQVGLFLGLKFIKFLGDYLRDGSLIMSK